jgi:PAS domain S-box-containing protein
MGSPTASHDCSSPASLDLSGRPPLCKSRRLFKIITGNAADMIALVNVKGRRLYNSPAYQKVLGYPAAELARTPVFERINPDDRARVLEASR